MVRSFRTFGRTFFFLSILLGKTDIFSAFDPGVTRLLSVFWNRPASPQALCPRDTARGAQDLDPALHYIRCALSYQNQLLADIKTLLQQLVPEDGQEDSAQS